MTQDTLLSRILTYFTLLLLLSRLVEAQGPQTLTLSEEDKQWALDFTKNFTGDKYPVYLFSDETADGTYVDNVALGAAFSYTIDFNIAHDGKSISVKDLKMEQGKYLINPLVFKYSSENSIKRRLQHEMMHAITRQTADKKFTQFLKEVNFILGKNEILQYGTDIVVVPVYFTRADENKFRAALQKDFESFDSYMTEKDALMALKDTLNRAEYSSHTEFFSEDVSIFEMHPQLKQFLNNPFNNSDSSYSFPSVMGTPMILHTIISLKSAPDRVILCATHKHLEHDFLLHMAKVKELVSKKPSPLTSYYLGQSNTHCNEILPEYYFNKMPTLFSQTDKQEMHSKCVNSFISGEIAAKILELPDAIQDIFFKRTSAYLHEYLDLSPDRDEPTRTPTINHNEL